MPGLNCRATQRVSAKHWRIACCGEPCPQFGIRSVDVNTQEKQFLPLPPSVGIMLGIASSTTGRAFGLFYHWGASSLWAAAHQVALEDALIHVFCGHGTLPLGIGEGGGLVPPTRNASCQRDDAKWGCACLFFLPFWKLLWMWFIFSLFLSQQVCYWEKSWVCSSVDIVFI